MFISLRLLARYESLLHFSPSAVTVFLNSPKYISNSSRYHVYLLICMVIFFLNVLRKSSDLLLSSTRAYSSVTIPTSCTFPIKYSYFWLAILSPSLKTWWRVSCVSIVAKISCSVNVSLGCLNSFFNILKSSSAACFQSRYLVSLVNSGEGMMSFFFMSDSSR